MTEKNVACVGSSLPIEILLYKSAEVQNAYEALAVTFHCFMLENDFVPKDVSSEEKHRHMPRPWKAKGLYKIFYSHSCCPPFICCMTCVPLYNTLSVQGIICDVDCADSINLQINLKNYIKQRKNFSDPHDVFSNINMLSRCFKDGFCLPLLNLLHETVGCTRLFGIRGLFDELKYYILEFLSVEDVMSMSAANKNFNVLANSPHLWKHLFLRDFAKDGVPDIDTSPDTNWKQLYKREYLKRKRRQEPRVCVVYPYPFYPDADIRIDFDPPLPDPFHPFSNILPNLPPRFPYLRRF